MGLPVIIGAAVLITGISVFSVYQVFFNNSASNSPSPSPVVESSFPPENLSSPQPSQSPQYPTNSPSPTTYPVIKPSPAVITLLQNNSTTQTSGNSIISGSIYLSGTAPSGTSIVIVARPHGTNAPSLTVASGVTAQTGSTWSWNSAQKGVEYDMVAVLKGQSSGQNVDYAQSLSYNLTAPTSGFMMTVNVGYIMSAPTGNITVTCNTHYSNNTWYATVNFPQVNSALMYWLQVGSTSEGTEIADISKNAQTQAVTLNDSQQYYAQYAVSPVSNPTSAQYSPFSGAHTIKCP